MISMNIYILCIYIYILRVYVSLNDMQMSVCGHLDQYLWGRICIYTRTSMYLLFVGKCTHLCGNHDLQNMTSDLLY